MFKNVFSLHTEEEESGKTFHATSSRHLYTLTCYREPLGHGVRVVHAPIQNKTLLSRKEVKESSSTYLKLILLSERKFTN